MYRVLCGGPLYGFRLCWACSLCGLGVGLYVFQCLGGGYGVDGRTEWAALGHAFVGAEGVFGAGVVGPDGGGGACVPGVGEFDQGRGAFGDLLDDVLSWEVVEGACYV